MFAVSGRARLAYDVAGERSGGPDVLLIHAGVTDRRSWVHLICALTPRCRCIAYDQRGFGETEYAPEDGYSPVTDALAVIDAAGSSRPVLVACSIGGRIALDLALAHPDRVAGLVLIAPAVSGAPEPELDPDGPEAAIDAAMTAADERGDIEEYLRLDARLWLDGPTAPAGRVGGVARELFIEMDRRAEQAPSPATRPTRRRRGTGCTRSRHRRSC